jgi:hypothetical protein
MDEEDPRWQNIESNPELVRSITSFPYIISL